jgi:hypothetical protein
LGSRTLQRGACEKRDQQRGPCHPERDPRGQAPAVSSGLKACDATVPAIAPSITTLAAAEDGDRRGGVI